MNSLPNDLLAQQYAGKRILVTGGAGFIGSHLVEYLVNLGAQVTVLDNFSTGSRENLHHVRDRVAIINACITDFDAVLAASRQQDFIFHCAAQVSVAESVEHPDRCYATNVSGTFNMLEAARLNHVKNFLFVSSSAVYGNQESLCHEEMIPSPTSPYGFSKLMGEIVCKEYASVYNIKTIMVRYFNVYGPRQNPHGAYAGVVAKFKHLMHNNIPITIFGDGQQQRDFVSVHQVVASTIMLPVVSEPISGQVFNIGSGRSMTITKLFAQLKKEFPDYAHEPTFAPPRVGDIYSSQADCTKFELICSTNLSSLQGS